MIVAPSVHHTRSLRAPSETSGASRTWFASGERLYAGIQDYYGRESNDYVVLDPPAGASVVRVADLRERRVTPQGGANTLRWFADRGRLYWITFDRDHRTHLRVTDDGDAWHDVPLPPEAGNPTDITRWRDGLVVLTDVGLWRVDGSSPTRLAPAPTTRGRVRGRPVNVSEFRVDDIMCTAPLGVFHGDLYAGSQRDGSLWRVVAEGIAQPGGAAVRGGANLDLVW